jgi:hypothetical protein
MLTSCTLSTHFEELMSERRPYAPMDDSDEVATVDDAPEGELDFDREPSRDLWDERDEDIYDSDEDFYDDEDDFDGGEY